MDGWSTAGAVDGLEVELAARGDDAGRGEQQDHEHSLHQGFLASTRRGGTSPGRAGE